MLNGLAAPGQIILAVEGDQPLTLGAAPEIRAGRSSSVLASVVRAKPMGLAWVVQAVMDRVDLEEQAILAASTG